MKVSVIIPVHNAAAVLARCLEALQRAAVPDMECIVVDDGSSDASRTVAARFPVTRLTLERCGGPARARNRGAAVAHGDLLVFLDSDVCAHADTLQRLERRLRDDAEIVAVFGSYDDTPADPHFVSQYKNLLHHYVHQHSRADAWTFWAGCGAIRRDVFVRVGGFDEHYTRPAVEDIELGLRLRAAGLRIALDPAIQVTHLKRWTVLGLIRTDLFSRAIPWLRLMLRHRTMPRDLNLTTRDRASMVLVWLLAFAAITGLLAPGARVLAGLCGVLCAAALCVLNRAFYRFLARQRGMRFAVRAVPLHWLSAGYCGLAIPLALVAHAWDLATPRRLMTATPHNDDI